MIQKIGREYFAGNGVIQTLYPGLALDNGDTGIGSIGRIDHAMSNRNGTIPMHPHINDEILSYFRSGKILHKDSEGNEVMIGKDRMMLMQAGKLFYHEETGKSEDEIFEGLQIFIRPSVKDLTPKVTFWDLDQLHSENKWRLVASHNDNNQFQFSSETWIYDVKLTQGSSIGLPSLPKLGLTCLLYVFKGEIEINDMNLQKKEAVIIKDEDIEISTNEGAELVLFVTNEEATIYKDGMFSGNKY
ncbi:pirin family protein [Chryseobacterium oranimense]|uniref:pirin family protein n=1 Tax=Chryseobacterium oranimense TaxID=421058 RepID=UPI002235E422|nr:pirin family protein [Chryseobacterium oranimense]